MGKASHQCSVCDKRVYECRTKGGGGRWRKINIAPGKRLHFHCMQCLDTFASGPVSEAVLGKLQSAVRVSCDRLTGCVVKRDLEKVLAKITSKLPAHLRLAPNAANAPMVPNAPRAESASSGNVFTNEPLERFWLIMLAILAQFFARAGRMRMQRIYEALVARLP